MKKSRFTDAQILAVLKQGEIFSTKISDQSLANLRSQLVKD